jgi:hypothetical protein
MKILFYSDKSEGLGLAYKCLIEQNEGGIYIANQSAKRCGDGLIDKFKTIMELARERPNLIVFDSPGHTTINNNIERLGIRTLFSSPLADKLRLIKSEVAKTMGLEMAKANARGLQISTEVWFQKGRPVFPALCIIKTKRFLTGNLGPNTDCQTSVAFPYKTKEPRLVQLHKKIWYMLEKAEYTGPWSIDVVVTNNKIYFDDMRPGISYNPIYAFSELLSIKLSDFFMQLYEGMITALPVKDGFGYAINISIPPYPYQKAESKKIFYPHMKHEHIWIHDLMVDNEGNYMTAGNGGIPIITTSFGESIPEADKNMRVLLSQVKIEDKQYRVDGANIGKILYSKLDTMGWL